MMFIFQIKMLLRKVGLLAPLSLLSFSISCIPQQGTGNAEPYGGVRDLNKKDPDDPHGSASTTYEVKAYSETIKVLVAYHSEGLHRTTYLQRDDSRSSFKEIATEYTEKKKISGSRTYEGSLLSMRLDSNTAYVRLKKLQGDSAFHQISSAVYDCKDKLSNAPFAGGLGTQENPYKICTAAQLNNIRNEYLGSYFVLWSEIDLSDFQEGAGWMPIGDTYNPFYGNFDGNLFAIRGLKISRTGNEGPVGLFGVVTNGGVLGNMNLVDADIRGSNSAGALVGRLSEAKIINIYTSGSIWARVSSAGGIVGSVGSVNGMPCKFSISRTHSSSDVMTQRHYPAGLVGHVDSEECSGEITDSSTSGRINAYSSTRTDATGAAGLIGIAYSAKISRCWSTAQIIGDDASGGLVGRAHHGSIQDSYFAGDVTARFGVAGGILGVGYNDTVVKRVYASGNIQSPQTLGGIVGEAFYDPAVKDSFFAGNLNFLEGSQTNRGAIVGYERTENFASMENTFWFSRLGTGALPCIGNRDISRCALGMAEELVDVSKFYNSNLAPLHFWDFENVWEEQSLNFPTLKIVY